MEWLYKQPRWLHWAIRWLTSYRLMATMQDTPAGRVRRLAWVRSK
jgi:hypothetical protein